MFEATADWDVSAFVKAREAIMVKVEARLCGLIADARKRCLIDG